MNRKGSSSPAIVFFVLLVIALFLFAIFTFSMNRSKIQIAIVGGEFVDDVLLQENEVKYQLSEFSRRAFLKTYDSFATNGEFFENDLSQDIKSNWKNEFFNKFESNFLNEVGVSGVDDEMKTKFKDLNIFIRGEEYYLGVSGFVFNSEIGTKKVAKLNYSPEIEVLLDFEKYLLEDFENVLNSVNLCDRDGSCYGSELNYFNVEFSDVGGKTSFEFKSKNYFFDLESKKISFSFVEK